MSARRRHFWPYLALLTIYVVWGSTYLAGRLIVLELPPFASAGLRFLAAGLLLGAVALGREKPRPTRRQVLDYALVGVLFLGGGNALVMWAMCRVPSGVAALLVATVPIWLMFLDGLRPQGQAWTVRGWAGVFVGLAGVALVAHPDRRLAPSHWLGILALQAASLIWSAGALYAQSIRDRLPLFTASATEMLAGAAALALESVAAGESWRLFGAASDRALWAMGYLIVFGSVVGFTAFALALNELPASLVGTYAYVNPIIAVALGAFWLGEPLSRGMAAGAALVLAGVVMCSVAPRARVDSTPDRRR